jgi:D-alanine transaminase
MQAYLNGEYLPHRDARVHVDDRGFLFADGAYEVVRVYDGRLFLPEPHVARLREGLESLKIRDPGLDQLTAVMERLVELNGIGAQGTVYLQVTRGVAPRKHAFPAADVQPTVYAIAKPFNQYDRAMFENGVSAITTPDVRWSRCDIKAIALLPNVLANQQAQEVGAFEAIFVRDGVLIEGSHSNLFAVVDGTLLTAPSSNYILTGITRNLVVELAHALQLPVQEAPVLWDQRSRIEELFLTGTTTEIMPVVRVDGEPIGDGRRGPLTARLQDAFYTRLREAPAIITGGGV